MFGLRRQCTVLLVDKREDIAFVMQLVGGAVDMSGYQHVQESVERLAVSGDVGQYAVPCCDDVL